MRTLMKFELGKCYYIKSKNIYYYIHMWNPQWKAYSGLRYLDKKWQRVHKTYIYEYFVLYDNFEECPIPKRLEKTIEQWKLECL